MENKPDSARKTLFSQYKSGAAKRKLPFKLTRKQFNELTKQNCWYCGVEPSQIKYGGGDKRHYCFYNGIDRVDNKAGYTEANCIPCCWPCNRMKSTLSGEDFVWRAKKIARNLDPLYR